MIIIQGFLLLPLFITASVIDIRRREIPDSINILFALTGLLTFSPGKFIGILIALPFLIAAIVCKGRMGGGDIKFMAAAGFILGFKAAVFASVTGLSASLLFCTARHILKRRKERNTAIPLAPFLSLGCTAAFTLQHGGLFLL
ncbi:MAG: A24 family peptidase [Oscillospiraceae bacterium]|nr:A24 family peptidase [Oscillospiraceae bacterium]